MFVPRKRRVAQRKEREEVAPSALPSSNCVGDLAIGSCLFSLHVWTRLYPSRAALSLASLFLQAARCYWSHLSRNIPGKTRSKTGTFKRHPKQNGALVFEEAVSYHIIPHASKKPCGIRGRHHSTSATETQVVRTHAHMVDHRLLDICWFHSSYREMGRAWELCLWVYVFGWRTR